MSRRGRARLLCAALAALHLAALAAPFLAPYSYASQSRRQPWTPPSRIRLVDADGGLHRPFVYPRRRLADGSWGVDSSRPLPLRFLVRGEPYALPGGLEGDLHLFGVDAPERVALLGTDGLGRDQLSRLLYGARVSLFAGLAAAAVALSLGTILGALAGYFRGRVDQLLMRLVEVFLSLPALYLLLGVRAFLPLEVTARQAFLLIVTIVGLLGWPKPARLVRGLVLSARERAYVVAARGFGASDLYLLWRHILPQTFDLVLTQAAILVPAYILAEVSLSFLGLGIAEPEASLGNLLAVLQRPQVLTSYGWMLAPAALLVTVILAYYALGEALKQARAPGD